MDAKRAARSQSAARRAAVSPMAVGLSSVAAVARQQAPHPTHALHFPSARLMRGMLLLSCATLLCAAHESTLETSREFASEAWAKRSLHPNTEAKAFVCRQDGLHGQTRSPLNVDPCPCAQGVLDVVYTYSQLTTRDHILSLAMGIDLRHHSALTQPVFSMRTVPAHIPTHPFCLFQLSSKHTRAPRPARSMDVYSCN